VTSNPGSTSPIFKVPLVQPTSKKQSKRN
jgi:hypothetical protein